MRNVLKGTLAAVIIVSLVLAMASCGGGGGGSPSAAVKAFVAAVEKGDTKAMEKVATADTVALIAAFGDKVKDGMKDYGKATYGEEKIDGDKATVKVSFENGQSSDVELVKVDGKWKVTMGK